MATTTPSAAFSWRRKRWGAKQWIFGALVGSLVAMAIVAGISISLAPAHISFSIASAGITNRTEKAGNQDMVHWFYNFTLLANNTSDRTKASYRHLKAEIWFGPTSWIPIDDVNATAEWQPPGNSIKIPVGTKFGQYSQASNATSSKEEGGSPGCPTPTSTDVVLMNTMAMRFGQRKGKHDAMSNATQQGRWTDSKVVVEAKVLFRFGPATTVPYIVRVSCSPVNFLNGTRSPVTCSG